jgi:hypothetical protein
VAPAACQTAAGSAEQEGDRHLLARARGRDVQADDAPEARDEGQDSPASAQVPADVRAEGQKAERQGDEPHHLSEHRPCLIAGDCCRVGETQAGRGGYLLI